MFHRMHGAPHMISILFLISYILLLAGSAWPLTIALGRLGRGRMKLLPFLIGGGALPFALMGYAIWLIRFAGASKDANDINGLTVFFLLFLPVILLPFSYIVAWKAAGK